MKQEIKDSTLPTIVCLCGSTKFINEFDRQMMKLTLEGKIVLTVGSHTNVARKYADGEENKKPMLDELHLRKIDLCDEVLILNVNGYIGESTNRELAYAKLNKKKICFLENL